MDILALYVALLTLAAFRLRQSQLVELLFGGLRLDETAAVLGGAPITGKRDWAVAEVGCTRGSRAERYDAT